jgi:hypothetical protein
LALLRRVKKLNRADFQPVPGRGFRTLTAAQELVYLFDAATSVEGDLDHTMLAVYWRTNQLSPAAASTREAAARSVRATLDRFARENGGVFPDDVIRALRFGDECFLWTGSVNSPKCAIPLYDYSDSGIAGYRKLNGTDEHPRAWGFTGPKWLSSRRWAAPPAQFMGQANNRP